jgi:hypothetical protein
MKIQPEDIDIENLFAGKYFIIPNFQRPYSWKEDELSDLWFDLLSDGSGGHFLGSMVVYSEDKNHFGVVDGQQRMTTLTIALSSLRDAYREYNQDDLADGLQGLIERKNIRSKNEYVLHSEASSPYFQKVIQDRDGANIGEVDTKQSLEKNIEDAYNFFSRKIDEYLEANDQDEIELLESLTASVLNSTVILITLDSIDDAYIIFETLNTRGMELSAADLLKNYLILTLDKDVQHSTVGDEWKDMVQRIEESGERSVDTYLYHFWNSKFDYVSKKKLYTAAKRQIGQNADAANNLLADLLENSVYYTLILSPKLKPKGWNVKNGDQGMRESLDALNSFKVKQAHSALLAVLRALNNKDLKPGEAGKVIRVIESFHFFFTALTNSRSSGGVQQRYCRFARKLEEARITPGSKKKSNLRAVVDDLNDRLIEALPSDDEIYLAFRQLSYARKSKNGPLVRYILNEYSKYCGKSQSADKLLTIEHIIPVSWIGRKASDIEGIPDDYFEGTMDESTVTCMGNLVLIGKKLNEELADLPFEKKRDRLIASGNMSDGTFSDCDTGSWGKDQVRQRTDNMVDMMDDVWPMGVRW